MDKHKHHEHLIRELTAQLQPIFKKSPQAIYLYLDDIHKSCNKKFSGLLGYKTPAEWVKNEYPLDDIAEKDQKKAVKAYMAASRKFEASSLSVTLVTQAKKKILVTIVMTPVTYKDEVFVLHFISKKK